MRYSFTMSEHFAANYQKQLHRAILFFTQLNKKKTDLLEKESSGELPMSMFSNKIAIGVVWLPILPFQLTCRL